ncbi:MAG: hypothetical protein WCJ64_05635 [Rhodospirillaceae bacterium]
MTKAQAYAIEVQDRSAGIVVADREGFIFFAADAAFRSLDRKTFRHVGHAESAARRLMNCHQGEKNDMDFMHLVQNSRDIGLDRECRH